MTSQPPHRPEFDDLLMAASLAERARWRGVGSPPAAADGEPVDGAADIAETPAASASTALEGAGTPAVENRACAPGGTVANQGRSPSD